MMQLPISSVMPRASTGYCFHRHPASPTAGRHQLQSEVIASDKQLEGRFELEKVLAHEPAGQAIAASHCFDLRLIPLPPLLRLLCCDQPGAVELCNVGRASLALACESPCRRRSR